MPEVGELVAGRYRLVSRVGQGAMGVVWRAWDERLDRDVAVKVMRPDSTVDLPELSRREGRVAAKLRHPNAVMVHDTVEHDGNPCLVMEYFASRSLATMPVLAPEEVARVGSQVASALAAAHADGIVHRDVKPGNVLVAEDGTAKIADFGISRNLGDGTMTGSEIVAGTPAYLAPEVASGAQASFSSDVFSLGATLYATLEGRPPFGTDDNPIALLHRIARGEVFPPRQRGPIADVVVWMLRHNPGERPTMREAHEAFTALAEGRPVHVPVERPLHATLTLPAGRRLPSRRLIGIGAALLLVVAGILIGTVLANRQPVTIVASTTETTQPSRASQSPSPEPRAECAAQYRITNSWPGGYQAEVTVTNNDSPELIGWTVRWTLPNGHVIDQLWNGKLSQDGTSVTVRSESYNAVVEGNRSTTFGLTAKETSGESPVPPAVTCQSP